MPLSKPANAVPTSRWASRPATPTPGPREDGTPRVVPGVYLLTHEASPQFVKPITVRVIRELADRCTYYDWAWIQVYVLNRNGDAIQRRELFVRPVGLRPVPPPSRSRARSRRRGTAEGDR
ncbi:hypothetical protein [Micromonospora maris]|uniref:hypothetical protein n=1 Tax=Micromonospora maris TaxID=1003110 RepID=UPI002E15A87D|nr:hypothetical protein OG712_25140 [Micromonospora maris]